MQNNRVSFSGLAAILFIVVLAVIGYRYLTQPDNRSATDRLGDAIHELPNGVDKASRELEDRTPGERLGDAIKDAGDKVGDTVKDQTAPQ